MTITATTNRIQYIGDGSSTGSAFPFRIFVATDLEVFCGGVANHGQRHGRQPQRHGELCRGPGRRRGGVDLPRRAGHAADGLVANDLSRPRRRRPPLTVNTIPAIQMAELIQTCLRLFCSEALVGEMVAAAARANKYSGSDNSGAPIAHHRPAGRAGALTGSLLVAAPPPAPHRRTWSLSAAPPSGYALTGSAFPIVRQWPAWVRATVNINGLGNPCLSAKATARRRLRRRHSGRECPGRYRGGGWRHARHVVQHDAQHRPFDLCREGGPPTAHRAADDREGRDR